MPPKESAQTIKLGNWLWKLTLNHIESEGEVPKQIELKRVTLDGGAITLSTRRKLKGLDEIATKEKCFDFVADFILAAVDDASMFDTPQRYHLNATFQTEEDLLSPGVRIKGEQRSEDFEGGEPPNMRGAFAQVMRHNEVLQRQVSVVIESMRQSIIAKDQTIAKLEERRWQVWEELEEARTMRHERDIEMQKERSKEERKERMLNTVMPMVPVVANKLMGKRALPEEKHPMVEMIKEAFAQMTPEEIQRVAAVLPVEKQIVLFSLFEKVLTEEKADENATNSGNGRQRTTRQA